MIFYPPKEKPGRVKNFHVTIFAEAYAFPQKYSVKLFTVIIFPIVIEQ